MEKQKGEVVVITGASAGVGRATVRKFAQAKAHIGLLARDEDRLNETKREVETLGGKALAIPTDVSHPGRVEAAARMIEEEFGPIDIWINNAMVSVFSRFSEMTSDEFTRVTEVTYLGTVYGTMVALNRMLKRNSGTIVQVGSALAYRSIPLQSAYCGAKHAIRGFTDSIRSELEHDGSNVHITMVHLPGLNTPQFAWTRNHMPNKPRPLGKVFQPEIAADAIYFAAHQRRRELFVGFPSVEAITGNKVIPGALDHYLAKVGFSGQQTDEPADPDEPDNLWEPVSADYAAQGNFSEEAKTFSPQLWMTQNRKLLGVLAAGAAGIGAGIAISSRRKSRSGNHK